MKTNYHTHSVFSDGKNTLEEICLEAIRKGFSVLGFSDHSVTDFDKSYCIKKERLKDYVSSVSRLKNEYSDRLEIALGIELDAFSEISRDLFDYIIGSAHYVEKDGVYYPVDHSEKMSIHNITVGFDGSSDAYAKEYYNTLCRHIEKNRPDIVGHIDLVAMYGTVDESTKIYKDSALETVNLAVEKGCVIELNTAAVFKKLKNIPYPSEFILKHIRDIGGKVTVDSDAHVKENLDFWFEETYELLRQTGFKTVSCFTDNHFEEFKL